MTEAAFQAKLLRALRRHPALKDGVVVKLSDRFTSGLPDVMVSIGGKTTFFELKVWPEAPTKIQKYFLNKFSPRSWVVQAYEHGSFIWPGRKGNQFILNSDSFDKTVSAVVTRCLDA